MAFLDKTGLEHLWAQIISKLGNKVDKVDGKGLSTNDYTTNDKNNLSSAVSHISNKNNPHSITKNQLGIYVQSTEPNDAPVGSIWVDTSTVISYAEGLVFNG